MDNSKQPVSRLALERVLARAAELQGAAGDDSESREALTEGQIVELGKEVGLSAPFLRQALAEERARSMTDEFILTESLERFIEQPDLLRALLELANAAKDGCPVSQALAGNVEITLDASLA